MTFIITSLKTSNLSNPRDKKVRVLWRASQTLKDHLEQERVKLVKLYGNDQNPGLELQYSHHFWTMICLEVRAINQRDCLKVPKECPKSIMMDFESLKKMD